MTKAKIPMKRHAYYCSGAVQAGDGYRQCARKGSVFVRGEWWCRQHKPYEPIKPSLRGSLWILETRCVPGRDLWFPLKAFRDHEHAKDEVQAQRRGAAENPSEPSDYRIVRYDAAKVVR